MKRRSLSNAQIRLGRNRAGNFDLREATDKQNAARIATKVATF